MHPMFRQWHIISPTQACKVGWKVPASWGMLNCCTQPWLIAMAFETPLEGCQALERFGSCTRQVLKTRPVQPRLVTMETQQYLCDQCVHVCCSLSHLQWGISIVRRSSIGSHRFGQVLLVNVGDMSTIVRSSLIQIGLSATRLLSHFLWGGKKSGEHQPASIKHRCKKSFSSQQSWRCGHKNRHWWVKSSSFAAWNGEVTPYAKKT